jgi:hypothetical protein
MSDLRLDYLTEARSTIGTLYERVSDTAYDPPTEDWMQVVSEALLSIAESLSVIAQSHGGKK